MMRLRVGAVSTINVISEVDCDDGHTASTALALRLIFHCTVCSSFIIRSAICNFSNSESCYNDFGIVIFLIERHLDL